MTHHKFYIGDSLTILKSLPSESVDCCVTSPPYWNLRDYGIDGQLGLEKTPEEYVAKMVEIFREVRRVLRKDGTVFLNLGDSYYSNSGSSISQAKSQLKPKDLIGIPWRVAFALQADGWYLRSDIIWAKSNPMPESVTDRPTKAHEYIFLLSKKERYYYDYEAIRDPAADASIKRWNQDIENQEGSTRANGGRKTNGNMKAVGGPKKDKQRGHSRRHAGFNDRWDQMTKEEQQVMGRNKRTVWTVATEPFPEAHFATYPTALIEPCILAGCPAGGTVLDPFGGSGTTTWVANKHGRNSIYIDLNPEYLQIALRRNGFTKDRLFDNSTYEVLEVAHETL